MFTVYVIYNDANDKFCIGQTNDVERRLAEHNSHRIKGYTSRIEGEWQLIYKESFSTRSEALKRETELKSHQGREHLSTYIPG